MQDSNIHTYTHTYVSRMRNVVQKPKAIDAFANIHTYKISCTYILRKRVVLFHIFQLWTQALSVVCGGRSCRVRVVWSCCRHVNHK